MKNEYVGGVGRMSMAFWQPSPAAWNDRLLCFEFDIACHRAVVLDLLSISRFMTFCRTRVPICRRLHEIGIGIVLRVLRGEY